MTARKSLPGRSSRSSRYSVRSQLSGVLNPDSNVISEDEANPLWYKDFENYSIRPSARFSLGQSESPVLDPNSEVESTPLQKDWWKNVDNTPFHRPSTSKASRERSYVQERSVVESSDVSSLDERVAKPRHVLRRNKRTGLRKNEFSKILDSSKDSTASEKIGKKPSEEKQDTMVSSSDSDVSIEKVRKQPFTTKRRARLVKQPSNIVSNSDESHLDDFRDALDGSQSPEEPQRPATAPNEAVSFRQNQEALAPASPDNAETVRLQPEHVSPEKRRIVEDVVESTSMGADDMDGSRSPVLMSRPKKRTKFTKSTNRNIGNFDDLLNDASNDEPIPDQPSIRKDLELNRSKRSRESGSQSSQNLDLPSRILAREDESDESEDSIVRPRVPFAFKKRKNQQEKSFTQLLVSPNASIRSEPVANKSRSSTQAKKTPRGVGNKSLNKELPESSDEEEAEEDISASIEEPPNRSGAINETQKDQEYSNFSRFEPREASTANTQTTMLMDAASKSTHENKSPSSKKIASMVTQNLEKGSAALQESNRDVTRERNGSFVADGLQNTENGESESRSIGATAQTVVNRTERSFSSPDNTRAGLTEVETSSRIISQASNVEKMSQIRNALEEVKKKELALMKNTKIDSYFKKVSANKPDAVAKDSQKATMKKKPVVNKKKTESTSPNKAYLVNGKVYKRARLPRPKPWATDRLYNFLWKKLEPKYKLRTRIRSEKFVIDMSQVVALVVRRKKYENYKEESEKLIREMARLGIIETRNDFYIFCRDFLPYEFREKVIPMLLPGNVRNIPFNPNKLHTLILQSPKKGQYLDA